MKIIVLCGGPFSFPALQALGLEKYLHGVAIGRGEPDAVAMLQQWAVASQMPFMALETRKDMPALEQWIAAEQPDYLFSIAFPFRIPVSILERLPGKCFNFHPGPLPAYRGAAPIFEVLKAGETETAVCVHYLEAGFDEGDIVFSDPVAIDPQETFGTLAVKMARRTSMAAMNMAQVLEFGTRIPSVPQPTGGVRYFPRPGRAEMTIDWQQMTAAQIQALVRACVPWQTGAIATLNGQEVRITEAAPDNAPAPASTLPGTITAYLPDGSLQVAILAQQCMIVRTHTAMALAAEPNDALA